MKLYMFRTVRLSIIRSLFTVHSTIVYVIQVCRQLSSRSICSCSTAVWHTPLLSVQWINSWWWTDELSETCRVSCQNKFVKLMHLVGFITKKVIREECVPNFGIRPFIIQPRCNIKQAQNIQFHLLHVFAFVFCGRNCYYISTLVITV